MDNHIHILAEKIWHYLQMNHQLSKADTILVLGSHDKRVAERGAQLFHEGWAPLLIFSGGLGAITKGMWSEPEADQFAANVLPGDPRAVYKAGVHSRAYAAHALGLRVIIDFVANHVLRAE